MIQANLTIIKITKYVNKLQQNTYIYSRKHKHIFIYVYVFPGHHGTGVVSYFVFLRYLLLVNFSMFLLTMFIWIPEALLDSTGPASGSLYETCSAAYTVNVSSDAFTLLLDFFQGSVSLSRCLALSYSCVIFLRHIPAPVSSLHVDSLFLSDS